VDSLRSRAFLRRINSPPLTFSYWRKETQGGPAGDRTGRMDPGAPCMPPSLASWRDAGTLMFGRSKVVDTFIFTQQILPTPHSQETMYGRRRFDRTSISEDASDSMHTLECAREGEFMSTPLHILKGWRLDCSTAGDYLERPTAADGTLRRMLAPGLRRAGRRHQQPE